MNTNETVDLSQPHLRRLFSSHPWLLVTVVILYTLLILLGILGNLLLLIMLLRSHTRITALFLSGNVRVVCWESSV